MSVVNIIDVEIIRRTDATKTLEKSLPDLAAVEEQMNKLDQMYRDNEKKSRDKLKCFYNESKYFTGKWPKVYEFTDTEYYPFFNGMTDSECNPYFPLSKVKDKTFDGLAPLYISPTGQTGTWARDRNYPGTIEPTLRTAALAAIAAYPNISGEVGVGSCSNPVYTTSTTCTVGGGTWTVSYGPGSTASEKLRTPLTAWRDTMSQMISDICDSSQKSFWQNLLNKANDILAGIPANVTYANHTPDFAPNSTADLARDYLISNATSINTQVTNRISYLNTESPKEEQVFFGIIKLRLNQGNGSLAKLKSAKTQIQTAKNLIKDNEDAIASLNLLKVKT